MKRALVTFGLGALALEIASNLSDGSLPGASQYFKDMAHSFNGYGIVDYFSNLVVTGLNNFTFFLNEIPQNSLEGILGAGGQVGIWYGIGRGVYKGIKNLFERTPKKQQEKKEEEKSQSNNYGPISAFKSGFQEGVDEMKNKKNQDKN